MVFDNSSPAILAAIVRHFIAIGARLNLPVSAALAAANVDEEQFKDPSAWIPLNTAENLLHAAMRMLDEPLLGLEFSQFFASAQFGVLGFLVENCSTLRNVVDMLIRYERLASDIGTTSLQYEPGVTLCCFDCKSDDALFVRQVTEYILGCILYALSLVDHPESPLLEVRFRHDPPRDPKVLERYKTIFRCPVLFSQERSCLVISNQGMDYPLRHANPQLQEALESHARALLSQRNTNPEPLALARSRLRNLVLQGSPSREALAEAMGMSARHLHRVLEKAGTSYRALLDELRLTLAQDYLCEATLTLDDIAQRLHFQEAQSFIRWFRNQTGSTPTEFRKNGHAPDAD